MPMQRKLRRVIWPLFSTVLLIGATWLVLLSPLALTILTRWALSSALGTRVEVTDARWDGWGRLSIASIRVLAEGWPGRTEEIVSIRGLSSEFRPLDLLTATIALEDLDVKEAVIRVARRTSDDALNLAALQPPTGRGWISFTVRPRAARLDLLRIENLVVEGDRITTLADPSFRGELANDPARGPHMLAFKFIEIEGADLQTQPVPRDAKDGLRLTGSWNERSLAYEVHANRLDFDQTVAPLLPQATQEYCTKRLALRGMVSDVRFKGTPARPLAEASLDVKGIALNLDELGPELGIRWERFSEGTRGALQGKPRMNVDRGTIVLANEQLRLDNFEGTLFSVRDASPGKAEPISVPLPVRMSLALDFSKLPALADMADLALAEAWFEAALRHCGVQASLDVSRYALLRTQPDTPWAVELPEPIVNVLDNFRVMQGSLQINARAERPASEPGQPAIDPKVSGSLVIREGRGAYVNFRYPLQQVEATIRFNDEQIEVASLTAAGMTGNRLSISGMVDGAGDDAGVDLRVRTDSPAPIDLDLQNAFDEGPRRIFELLFARDMRDRLVAAGLLREQGTELGGTCEFDIRVKRVRGGGSRVETTGSIDVRNANVLCSRFPYPIRVEEGFIELQDEAIVLPPKRWTFHTPKGGTGSISGKVAIPRAPEGGRLARPDLDLVVAEDRVNDLLLAAIPLEDWKDGRSRNPHWPGRDQSVASQSMKALQLEGELNLGGHIGSTATGDTTLAIDILLADGAFRPRNGPEHLLERSGLPWPEGFDLDNVTAKVRLTEREATLIRLEGEAGEGRVIASGAASLRERDRSLTAELKRAPIGQWMVPLLPEEVRTSAADAWERCDVKGAFDGSIDIRQRATGTDDRRARFVTRGVTFQARGVPSELRVTRGALTIDGPTLGLDGVRVEARCRDRRVGVLEAEGSIALDPSGKQDLRGTWMIDDFASLLWPEVLDAANLERISDLHDDWNPVGFAGGTLLVTRTAAGEPDWDIEVTHDGVLVGDPGGVPISLSLVPGGHLAFGPDSIGVRGPSRDAPGLVGCLPGGEFALDGVIATGPRGPRDGGAVHLRFDVGPIHEGVVRVLPKDLADALGTIELRAGNASSDDLRLLGWIPESPEPGLTGTIDLQDGSMRAGTVLSRIHAPFRIDARGGRTYPVEIQLGCREGTFLAGDRFFDRADGLLRLTEGAKQIEIIDLQSDLYGGRACASAVIGGPANDWRLDLRIDGASLPGLIRGGANTSFAAAGFVRGSLSLGGDLDGSDTLRGIGHLEASDARMGELPLTLRVLQATQLMLPLSDSLERASLDFHVRGKTLRFERFDLSCPLLRLMGTGSMDLATWDVALRFRNRGVVPGLSDLFGAASDALFVIDVTGPASDPAVQVTPLPPLGQDPSMPSMPERVAAVHGNHP
ncbi:MAG: hypothetical protein ACOYMI_03645 [Phycisphaerales bacterium]